MISYKFHTMAVVLLLTACAQQPASPSDEPPADSGPTPAAASTDSISILRPDVEPPEPEPTKAPLPAFEVTIGFPGGGTALDADAVAALEEVLGSRQLALGGPITLRAHSDSAGTDEANIRASEGRGLAVAEWLIDQGVAADRITVVAFGEQNPARPNALADGSPNKTGRAANRRVEIEIPNPSVTASQSGETASEDRSAEPGDQQ